MQPKCQFLNANLGIKVDSFLDRVITENLLLLILGMEILILSIFMSILVLTRIILNYRMKQFKKKQEWLSSKIVSAFQKEQPIDKEISFKGYSSKKLLLTVLEDFDRRIRGGYWETLKNQLAETYLLPTARKLYSSKFWTKRWFAGRCFMLYTLPEDEKIILKLLNDPVFLVQSLAALTVARLENREGILKILTMMALKKGYDHYYYRDVLLQGSKQVFAWIEEIAASQSDKAIHLACLEMLASKIIDLSDPFLQADAESNDPDIRLAAIKVYARNPQVKSFEILYPCLDDSREDIKAEACRGMENFISEKSLNKLKKNFQDEAWNVRLQSARSLAKMIPLGVDYLKEQDPNINKNAYDLAQYALQFYK